jgi:tetratricopeptide (TPR) repeat protein
MMKHSFTIGVGLALLVVLPTAGFNQQAPESLQQALDRTIAALEQLAGLDQRLSQHDTSAIRDARAWTEPALAVPADRPQARDEELDQLRHDVVALQGALDGDTRIGATPVDSAGLNPATAGSQPAITATPATTGLDEAARHGLSAPSNAPTNTAKNVVPVPAPAAKRAFEPSGYSADALEFGRALYRREKFDAALVQFESQGTNIEATYWKARCLDRLNKQSEAIAAYNQVIASPSAGALVARAKDDVEFLAWRIAIESATKPASGKEQP